MPHFKKDLSRELLEIPYETLRETLTQIPSKRDQALLSTVYACYGRIGEIVQSPYVHSRPLRKTDFKLVKQGKKLFLRISIYTLKSRGKGDREIYINTDREGWLAWPIINWVKTLRQDQVIFESPKKRPMAITHRTAERAFYKYFGTLNIHLMRSWRTTHAAQGVFTEDGKPLDIRAVQVYGGWKDTQTLSRVYNKATGKDYLKVL